jgi:hypothetical protein
MESLSPHFRGSITCASVGHVAQVEIDNGNEPYCRRRATCTCQHSYRHLPRAQAKQNRVPDDIEPIILTGGTPVPPGVCTVCDSIGLNVRNWYGNARAYKREASVAFPLGVVRAILNLREKASHIDTFRASPLSLYIEQFRFPSPLFLIISRSKTLRTVLTWCMASSDVIPRPFPLFPRCS